MGSFVLGSSSLGVVVVAHPPFVRANGSMRDGEWFEMVVIFVSEGEEWCPVGGFALGFQSLEGSIYSLMIRAAATRRGNDGCDVP